jgi:hypothetical protein
MDNQPEPVQPKPELIPMDDMGVFIGLVEAWHAANIGMLKQMQHIPNDGSISVEYEGVRVPVQGDIYKGMMMGLIAAIGMFGQLPFAEIEDEPAKAD